jgi:hypothetical protein
MNVLATILHGESFGLSEKCSPNPFSPNGLVDSEGANEAAIPVNET